MYSFALIYKEILLLQEKYSVSPGDITQFVRRSSFNLIGLDLTPRSSDLADYGFCLDLTPVRLVLADHEHIWTHLER